MGTRFGSEDLVLALMSTTVACFVSLFLKTVTTWQWVIASPGVFLFVTKEQPLLFMCVLRL